jgi:5'-3' exoribonuclease 1
MGIPSYFSYIVRKHRQIIKTINNSPNINNLYLDCNSFIYEAFYNLAKGSTEQDIIQMTCENIAKIIKLLKPDERVFIAFDGVAPLAKLNQQRNRRYMAAFQASLDNSHEANIGSANKWNTAAITPGTAFMAALGQAVIARFADPAEFGVTKLIVSTADEPGEGEHKIYAYIRAEAAAHQTTTTVIYGLDADLIMLTINHLHLAERMYLFRETPEFIKNIDKTLNPRETYLLDIPLFARSIIKELDASQVNTPLAEVALHNEVLYDYIFMCFFLGNDFLPHFPALNIRTNGINKLIEAYKQVFPAKETLTQQRQIVWKNVRKFVGYLAQNELAYIQAEYVQRAKASKYEAYREGGEDENLLLPLKERSVEIYINPQETGWEKRYYTALFNLPGPSEAISTNYLAGLEWTMKYYSTGCADWRWKYNYYYPPLLTDLLKQVPYFDCELMPIKPPAPVNPLVQLSYVLPPSSMHLLPPGLHAKLIKTKPEWYVGNYTFVWAFCKFFWEAHVDLPEIDCNELEMIVL